MANFMSRIVDYRRNGPGVRKKVSRDYTWSEFWRIYAAKFFKLLGLNAMYFGVFALIVFICYIPLNRVLNTSNLLTDKLEAYELNAEFKAVVSSYYEAYKLDDDSVEAAIPSFCKALDIIRDKNPDLLKDGTSAFNIKKFTQEDKESIFAYFQDGFHALSFSLSMDDEGAFIIKDPSERTVLTCTVSEKGIELADTLPRSVMDMVKVILCLAPAILLSPFHLAFFRVTKDYVQGNPSFMFSDIWDTIKKNWWQSLVIGVLTYLSFSMVGISLLWYWSYFNSGWFSVIGFALCMVIAYVVVSMSFYVGIMQVTLDTTLRKVLKNAFYFSVICLWRNLFMILVTLLWILLFVIAFIFGMAYPVIMSLTFTFMIIAFFSFWFYFISFMTYPSILKYVVDPYYAELRKQESEEKADDPDAKQETQDEPPEYVYYNGRMVHRSVLEQEQLFQDDTNKQD